MDNDFSSRGPSRDSYISYNEISQRQAAQKTGCDAFFQQYIKGILEESQLSSKFMKRESVKPMDILREVILLDPLFSRSKFGLLNLTKDEILVDPNQFKFAFHKIIENATAYNEGKVQAVIQVEKSENLIVISCKDKGIGIDKFEKAKIFNPFFRGIDSAKFSKGIGLGLTLSREVLLNHNADIRVESAGRGLGTSVYVSFPIKSKSKQYLGQASRPMEVPSRALAY